MTRGLLSSNDLSGFATASLDAVLCANCGAKSMTCRADAEGNKWKSVIKEPHPLECWADSGLWTLDSGLWTLSGFYRFESIPANGLKAVYTGSTVEHHLTCMVFGSFAAEDYQINRQFYILSRRYS